ncbi:hypothetical protein Q7P37_009111 [Cladosporium fusiforme]
MAFDEKSITESHNTTHLTVQSNTQISSRATAVVSNLSGTTTTTPEASETTTTPAKPALVILHAQSRWASKLISIVEIAKRDLQSKGVAVFQYTALSSEIVEIDRVPKAGFAVPSADGQGSDDEAFQTMGADKVPEKKKRAVPVMTVYLAVQSVKALKSQFGEQRAA